ncbi:hypothetical protein [Halovivax cerinus]|uniref:Uncharacterized protein n=1 Tax=Halovivax cerinus TaxID=1487865 RepID=A0ABD5NTD8_9EURY|nr:hypothetical protein [Halovivax cerinus]
MSETISQLETPLLFEDNFTGRVFHLSLPDPETFRFEGLAENLRNRTHSIDDDDSLEDRDDIHIPEIFQSGLEEDTRLARIKDVEEINVDGIQALFGRLFHNKSDTVKYKRKKILVLDEQETKFVIFRQVGSVFLLIISSRENMRKVLGFMDNMLENLGIIIDEISISHEEFEEIGDDLIDTHLMTSVEDYKDASIHKKHIMGRGFGSSKEYEREMRRGSVHGQRFGTSKLEGPDKTVQISDDCLVRSYNKITLSSYLYMITSYIVPNLRLTRQTSVIEFGSETDTSSSEEGSEK